MTYKSLMIALNELEQIPILYATLDLSPESHLEVSNYIQGDFQDMLRELRIAARYAYIDEIVGPAFYEKLDNFEIEDARKILNAIRDQEDKDYPNWRNPIFSLWESQIDCSQELLNSSDDYMEKN